MCSIQSYKLRGAWAAATLPGLFDAAPGLPVIFEEMKQNIVPLSP